MIELDRAGELGEARVLGLVFGVLDLERLIQHAERAGVAPRPGGLVAVTRVDGIGLGVIEERRDVGIVGILVAGVRLNAGPALGNPAFARLIGNGDVYGVFEIVAELDLGENRGTRRHKKQYDREYAHQPSLQTTLRTINRR